MTPLERRYRILLRAYPNAYRDERQAELLGVLLDSAPKGQTRPAPREAIDLVCSGTRTRLRTLPTVTVAGGWCDVAAIAILGGPPLLAALLLIHSNGSAATIAVAISLFIGAVCLVVRRPPAASVLHVCGAVGFLIGLLSGWIDSHAFAGLTLFVIGVTLLHLIPSMWVRCYRLTGTGRRGTSIRTGILVAGVAAGVSGASPILGFLMVIPTAASQIAFFMLRMPLSLKLGFIARMAAATFGVMIGVLVVLPSGLPNPAENGLAFASGAGRAALGTIMVLLLMVWIDGRIQRRWVSWRRQSAPTPT